ncbi:hypothetical protein E2562_024204 [Oryza meyeriana var. granulata]|uniref:Uncharacterized protein n=1 Tax=Oryza meyeriana var. granulata TaxID=110450 RepID=A0A6G1C068_9ORYZ|nr:hypothetical protein E2562_024204 [Oryza meyeriana var. granulata]
MPPRRGVSHAASRRSAGIAFMVPAPEEPRRPMDVQKPGSWAPRSGMRRRTIALSPAGRPQPQIQRLRSSTNWI